MKTLSEARTVNEMKSEISRPGLLLRSTMRLGTGTGLSAAILFLAAGSLDWPMAWVYLGLVVVAVSVATALMLRIHPDLIAERSHVGEGVKPWDKVLSRLMALVVPLSTLLVAGLDRRWGWSYFPQPDARCKGGTEAAGFMEHGGARG